MPNRLFLIHGYIEDPTIFDKLIPLLPPANYVSINLADEFLRWQPAGRINIRLLAQYIIDHYDITSHDVVIGHSLGGWAAINIKQLCGAKAIQLASWTDQKKIKFPVHNLRVLKFMVNSGITQSRALNRILKKLYPFPESQDLYNHLVDSMTQMSHLYLWQQMQSLFARVPSLMVQPDLCVHARQDSIVAPPDEPYVDVPGDHFGLVFYPELVAKPIRALLNGQLKT